jgi:molybdopterin-containing oxidoreductase family molybdopterin binding subunit
MFANISWIREFDPGPALDINPADARERGIRDGDLVRVFNDRGEMKLKASVHEGVMQGVANVSQGWSPGDYAGGFHQALTHNVINPAQAAVYEPNAAYYDVAVQVERVQEG